jgi:hypothetical protein
MALLGGKSKSLTDEDKSKPLTDEEKISAASFSIALTFLVFGFGGAIVIGIWSYGVATPVANAPALGLWGFLGTDLLVALAAAAAGSLFGFVFGIPRTLDPAGQVAVASAGLPAGMAANTNLERISDWLTTLLIGATLVQIKDIAHWVGSLGEHLTATGAAANDAMIPIIVIYYFALAFLGVYLITRLYLTSAFQQILEMLVGKKQPPPGIDQLKQVLDDAVKSGTAVVQTDAERDDPKLNANVARILAKQIADGTAKDRAGSSASDLKNAIAKAAADLTIRAQLKKEADSGQLKTKDDALDAEISKALEPDPS